MFEARQRRLESVGTQPPIGLARPFLLFHGPCPRTQESGDLLRLPLVPALTPGSRVGVAWKDHALAGLSTLVALLHGAAAETDSGVQSLDLKRADLRDMAAALGSATVEDFARAATEWAFDFCSCEEWLRAAGVPQETHTTLLTATDAALQLRLCLAACAVQQPIVLVLKDPTRGLDGSDKAALTASLRCFPGACILLSDDRDFLRTVCSRTWVPLPCGRMLDTVGTAAL
jgi:ATPase subunit of ABC transporter with duplicated ATPase domains